MVTTANVGNEEVKPGTNSRKVLWLLMGLAVAMRISIAVRAIPNGLADDGYVTFRYAHNLINGMGLVYNAGERVMGTTSPLLTFLLAALGRVFGPSHIEALAVSLGILATVGTLYYCERILERAGVCSAVKWNYLAVVAFLPSFLCNSVSGMETAVVIFLMSISLYLCLQDRLIALSIVGFLLFLSRIDAGIWLLALAIHLVVLHRDKLVRKLAVPLGLFCVAMIVWLSFTKIYFGTIIPESVTGKAVSHGAFTVADWQYALTYFSAYIPAVRFGVRGLAIIAAAFLVLIPFALELWRNHPALRPVLYFFVLYVAIFFAGHAPLFAWYEIPPKWAFYLIAVYAVWRILSKFLPSGSKFFKPGYALAAVGVLAFVLGARGAKNTCGPEQRQVFVALSNYIDQNLPPQGSVFLEHIGLVGYKTGRYIYDSMGLVTPESVRLKRLYGPAWLPEAAREFNADLVVLYDEDLPVIRSQTDADAIWFQNNYTQVKEYSEPGLTLWLFRRNDRMKAWEAPAPR